MQNTQNTQNTHTTYAPPKNQTPPTSQPQNKTYVIDTNIILDDPYNLINLYDNGNNKIVIPETVLDEIDTKKSGFDDINYNAREFARCLEESDIKDEILTNISINNNSAIFREVQTYIETLDMYISIISQNEYSCESDNIALNILNDRKILESANYYKCISNECVIILTIDILCRTRALSYGLKTETLKGKHQKIDMVFHKELVIDGLNQSVNGKLIKDLDPDYQPMYYSYSLIDEQTSQQKLAQVQNNHIYLIDDNELNKQIINPINKEQKFFVNAIINGHYDIMAIDAKAGSGKTLLSLATAMRLIKNKNTNYNNIIYIRNSIESLDKGEDIGYLPGLEEKFKIYNHPLIDNLKFIARSELQKRKQNTPKFNLNNILEEDVELRVSKYIRDYNIETMWVGEMRGRTLSNAFVIIDEAQNMSAKTLQLILSRVDKTCKVIVIGSNKQIDNLYINKYINGLSKLLKAANESHEEVNLWAGELNKVVRGPVTEFAERIFSK